jgi:hypothetical protein
MTGKRIPRAEYLKLINVTATPPVLPRWFEPYTYWRMTRARGIPVPAGLYTRPRGPGIPRNITVKEFGWVLDEWDRYLLWEAWIDSGRKGSRPYGLWRNPAGKPISPAWAGRTLKIVHKYRKAPPKPPTPAPPPPHNYDVSIGFSWIVMAQEYRKIEMYPPYYGVMYTADSAYERPTADFIQRMKQQGRRQRSWCDCHSTFPDTAKKMAADLGLDGWCGEGESAPAFQVGVDAGAELMLINISALTPDQKEKYLRTRKTVAINELYLNQDSSRASRENWENLPIAGRLIACYDATSEASTGRYFSYAEYASIGKYAHHHDSFYDPGAKDVDRQAIP